jgi:hypothetical protein
MKANGEPERFIQPRCAAHATTAGGVSARKPAAKPMATANARIEFIENGLTQMLRREKPKGKRSACSISLVIGFSLNERVSELAEKQKEGKSMLLTFERSDRFAIVR